MANEFETDKRGVIIDQAAFRKTRAAEQWERYDTTVIAQAAEAIDDGWFSSWLNFANSPQITLFNGRSNAVGPSYTNQPGERLDYAQDIHQTACEVFAPSQMGDFASNATDNEWMPLLFTTEFPRECMMSVVLAEADEIARAPLNHFPSSFGNGNSVASAAAAPLVIPGTQGTPHVSNCWHWPEPILLAAKSKLTCSLVIDRPIKALFQGVTGPGVAVLPDGAGGTVNHPLFYGVKVTHRGPRYLQLRGARSSA